MAAGDLAGVLGWGGKGLPVAAAKEPWTDAELAAKWTILAVYDASVALTTARNVNGSSSISMTATATAWLADPSSNPSRNLNLYLNSSRIGGVSLKSRVQCLGRAALEPSRGFHKKGQRQDLLVLQFLKINFQVTWRKYGSVRSHFISITWQNDRSTVKRIFTKVKNYWKRVEYILIIYTNY